LNEEKHLSSSFYTASLIDSISYSIIMYIVSLFCVMTFEVQFLHADKMNCMK